MPHSSLNNYQACSQPIRVPTNAHPSQQPITHTYSNQNTGVSATDTLYYCPTEGNQSLSGSMAHSFRDTFNSVTDSYSRTSALYIAENLPLPGNRNFGHGRETAYDEEQPYLDGRRADPETKDPLLENNDFSLDRTMSQQTIPAGTGIAHPLLMPLSRHTTIASVMSQQLMSPSAVDEHMPHQPLKSTFAQSVFNAVNVLIGVGILTLPLVLRYTGWLLGTLIFLFCAAATNYTAKLLAKCLDVIPDAATYADMGMAAFGDRGRAFIGLVFIAELVTMAVAMVTLLGDGIQAIFTSLDLVSTRVISLAIVAPTLFLPLRRLAFTSLIGIVSCASLVLIVLFDGLSKPTRPGSLLSPMDTEIIPSDPSHVPIAFGLVMACFAGHAVFPSIYRDMEDPKQYNRMVDITYIITCTVCVILATVGYVMFGEDTMQEITQNLAVTPGYYKMLNYIALWLIVLTPIAKYSLIVNPLNISLELWVTNMSAVEQWLKSAAGWKNTMVTLICRLFLCCVTVYIATVFPGFDRVMSLLGALFSFGISAIFPIICYQKLYRGSLSIGESIINMTVLLFALAMAVTGTIWSFFAS